MFFLHACFASLARLIVIYTVMWNYVIVSHRKLLFWMVIDCARMFYNCYFCHCRECLYFQRCVYMFRWFFKKLFSLSLVSIDLMRIGLRSVYFVRCVWFLYTFIFLFFFFSLLMKFLLKPFVLHFIVMPFKAYSARRSVNRVFIAFVGALPFTISRLSNILPNIRSVAMEDYTII